MLLHSSFGNGHHVAPGCITACARWHVHKACSICLRLVHIFQLLQAVSFRTNRTLSTCWKGWRRSVSLGQQDRWQLTQAARYSQSKRKCACWIAWVHGTSALWQVDAYVAWLLQRKFALHSPSHYTCMARIPGLVGQGGCLRRFFSSWKSCITAAHLRRAVIQERMHGLHLLLTGGVHPPFVCVAPCNLNTRVQRNFLHHNNSAW